MSLADPRRAVIDGAGVGAIRRCEFSTTWYELDVEPRIYWRVWTDAFIHEIHSKVLRHIAAQVQTR